MITDIPDSVGAVAGDALSRWWEYNWETNRRLIDSSGLRPKVDKFWEMSQNQGRQYDEFASGIVQSTERFGQELLQGRNPGWYQVTAVAATLEKQALGAFGLFVDPTRIVEGVYNGAVGLGKSVRDKGLVATLSEVTGFGGLIQATNPNLHPAARDKLIEGNC